MTDTKGLEHLKKDRIMLSIIKSCTIKECPNSVSFFQDVVETILGQQLSGKAADTIINRFKAKFKPGKFPTAKQILALPEEQIRECGTSWAKVKYIKNFSEAYLSGALKEENLREMEDQQVILELTKVKGIGKWTAEMILIFTLRRPDIFSTGDQGLKNAMVKHYGVKIADLKKMEEIAAKWSPHRSLASRYLWESLNNR